MANYSVGQETKQKIILTARRLFYKNGLENTTYSQISKLASVNLGTIVYHFGTLEDLGRAIYDEILMERSDLTKQQFRKYKLYEKQTKTVLALSEYRINTQSYLDYPKYARFILDMVHRKKIWLNEALQISTELICAEYGKT